MQHPVTFEGACLIKKYAEYQSIFLVMLNDSSQIQQVLMEALCTLKPDLSPSSEATKQQIINEVLVLLTKFIQKQINLTTFHTSYLQLVKRVHGPA